MKLWHAYVGPGRFIVRAETEAEAIALAQGEAEGYFAPGGEVEGATRGADELLVDGDPAVLDIDFS